MQILLGSGDDQTAERLSSMLGELPAFDLQKVAGSSQDVLLQLDTGPCEVLVLDEDLGPLPVLDLVRQVAQLHPLTAVVLLVTRTDQDTMRLAMEAGVRSLLPRAFTLADVESRLEAAGAWSTTVRRHLAGEAAGLAGGGRMVAFCGAKGGVGTTTVALHVALEAAASGLRTCLVDLDLQSGDVAHLLNIVPNRDIVDLVDVASGITARALDDVLYRHPTGLRILLAPVEGERGEEIDAGVASAVFGALTSHFEVVIVDCGAVLGSPGAAAVSMAGTAVVVLTPDTPSVLGARRMQRLWGRLGLRSEDEQPTVLVNRVARSVDVQPELVQRMLRLTTAPMTLPANFSALEGSVNTGLPERVVDRDLRRALAALASALEVRAVRPTAAEPSRRRHRRDRGQVAVETLGVFLLLAVVCLVLVQAVLLGASAVFAEHAATAGAREAVLPSASATSVVSAVREALPGPWRPALSVDPPSGADRSATVRVAVRTPAVVPLVDRIFGDRLVVRTRAALQAED